MEEEAGSGILAGGFISKSQVNALLKIYILKMSLEMHITHVQILSSWHVIGMVVMMSLNAPRVPT